MNAERRGAVVRDGLRYPAAAAPEAPVANPAAGQGSTTATARAILCAALGVVDPSAAAAIRDEKHWHSRYPAHFVRLVDAGRGSATAAVAIARAGLAQARASMRFARDREEQPLDALERVRRGSPLGRVEWVGRGDQRPAAWGVPWRGAVLRDQALRDRLADWSARGIIEPSAADALCQCIEHPEWFDLSDRRIVLLGAGAEAGPLEWLARWRARIVGIDLPAPGPWRRIAGVITGGNARLIAPTRSSSAEAGDAFEHAGIDLLTDLPELIDWLGEQEGPLDLASHAYADGEKHVRVSLAMDAIAERLCTTEPRTSLAYLATPTDAYGVPAGTVEFALARLSARGALARAAAGAMRRASGGRLFLPNVAVTPNGGEFGIVDALVLQQGPNYALAKRLQQWRAIVAHAQGHRVSFNVAPSTTTASVVRHPALAAAFRGAASFGVEPFEPATTHALMAALWVHDLRAAPPGAAAHPYHLIAGNACHGGMWRIPYQPRTVLPLAAAKGFLFRG